MWRRSHITITYQPCSIHANPCLNPFSISLWCKYSQRKIDLGILMLLYALLLIIIVTKIQNAEFNIFLCASQQEERHKGNGYVQCAFALMHIPKFRTKFNYNFSSLIFFSCVTNFSLLFERLSFIALLTTFFLIHWFYFNLNINKSLFQCIFPVYYFRSRTLFILIENFRATQSTFNNLPQQEVFCFQMDRRRRCLSTRTLQLFDLIFVQNELFSYFLLSLKNYWKIHIFFNRYLESKCLTWPIFEWQKIFSSLSLLIQQHEAR